VKKKCQKGISRGDTADTFWQTVMFPNAKTKEPMRKKQIKGNGVDETDDEQGDKGTR